MKTLKEKYYEHLQVINLEELFGYVNEIGMGYIRANYHPEDSNIVILNYTEKTTFERRWNQYTMTARGLILDLTSVTNNGYAHVLAIPFEKFPNYGSNEIEGYEDDIDFDAIEHITEKLDGSLGISYFFNDELRFATKGSFTSEQAIKATEIWRDRHAKFEDLEMFYDVPVTFLVEIIYPENRVVVDYNGREELVLLGANRLFPLDGLDEREKTEIDMQGLVIESEAIHMELAKKYEKLTLEKILEAKKTLPANEEGWVVKFKNGKRLKVKGEQYLNVHRIKHGLSEKAKYKAWSEDKLDEYIMMLPEEFRGELEEFKKDLDELLDANMFILKFLFKNLTDTTNNDRKAFAILVEESIHPQYKKFMFEMFNTEGVAPTKSFKEHVFKNYTYYSRFNVGGTIHV